MTTDARRGRCLASSLLILWTGLWAVDIDGLAGMQTVKPPSISLQTAVGGPARDVRVPIYLESGNERVASLTFNVSFPSPPFSFVKLEVASRRLEPVAETVKTRVVEGAPDVVEVELSHPKNPFPDGPLGWLIFHVVEKAEAKEWPLEVLRPVANTASGEKLPEVKAEGAKVVLVVEEELKTLTSCFFYMH
jgi:hypothetical protein